LAGLLILTLDLSVAEFIHLQSLSTDERRERFGLAQSCAPTIAAFRPSARQANRILVLIERGYMQTTGPVIPRYQPAGMLTDEEEDDGG